MFVRKKKNKSGSISIQIISKEGGKYKVVKTIGSSKCSKEIKRLSVEANHLISIIKEQTLLELITVEDKRIDRFVETLSNTHVGVIGPELIFGALFDRIGFNVVPGDLFRHLVITRLAYPGSKLKTVDYLQRYKGIDISVDRVYLFLDKLQSKYKSKVEKIAFEYTKKILKGIISVVFYDMTTLYFEAEAEDDLRKIGFSKDGKFQKPQIVLGLLVGKKGYPIGYDIFEGNTFEGYTLLPVLEDIQKKFQLKQPIVVADAGLLSKNNLENLSQEKYKYIMGARIKNETAEIKEKILESTEQLKGGHAAKLKKPNGVWLIVTYSDKRAKKDKYNRERGLKKLRAQVSTGKLTKRSINNRGYNKFLKLTGNIEITIDEGKIEADKKWDGLKGYLTNTRLSPKVVIENYNNLWQIEKAFRISKTDLKVRPIYHRLKNRIEAHICIAFAAYLIYKELERLLYKNKVVSADRRDELSVNRAIELTRNMYEMRYTLPDSRREKSIYLKMDSDQQLLYDIIVNQ